MPVPNNDSPTSRAHAAICKALECDQSGVAGRAIRSELQALYAAGWADGRRMCAVWQHRPPHDLNPNSPRPDYGSRCPEPVAQANPEA